MTRFVRFIFLIVAAGIAVSLGIVLSSDLRSQRQQRIAMTEERAKLEQVFARYHNRLRRAAIVVEWQKVNAVGEVLQSSLLVRRYGLDDAGKPATMPVQRIVVPGARVCIDGLVLEFDALFSEEFKALRNVHLNYFAHVYGEGQNKDERFNFLHEGDVPDATQIHPDRVTHEEMRLWRYVWVYILNPKTAPAQGLKVQWRDPACRTLKNGQAYMVFMGEEGIVFENADDPSLINDLLREAERQDRESGADQPTSLPKAP